jgi:hypothetical protein
MSDADEVTEAECLICRRWPEAERVEQRSQYFPTDGVTRRVVLIPVRDICPACERAAQAWKIAVRRH